MDSLNLLFGLSTKMAGAFEKPISETANVYTNKFGATCAGNGLIQELLRDDCQILNNLEEQKLADLNFKQITY